MTVTTIYNIGTLLSGSLDQPVISSDSIVVESGIVNALGRERDAEISVDVGGATVIPGIIDSHHHPHIGDYHPVVSSVGYTERYLESGVTGLVSCGSYSMPGHPLGPTYGKHLAILVTQSFRRIRPAGIKTYAETMIVEPGLEEADLIEAAAAGVKRVKFLLPIPTIAETERIVRWAHERQMLVLAHCGGRKLVGEAETIGDALRIIRPDVAAHMNGGPTPPPWEDARWLLDETNCYVDLVYAGNLKMAADIVQILRGRGQLQRVLFGTDSPTPYGMFANGVACLAAFIASMTDLTASEAVCLMTGNAARAYGLSAGTIGLGQPADLVVCDARDGSVAADAMGDLKLGNAPAVGLVMIDGEILIPEAARRYPTGRYVSRSSPKRQPVMTRS